MVNEWAPVPQRDLGKLSVVAPIPRDVLQLLWFNDGPLKNHDPVESSESFEAGPLVVTIRFGPSEPSAISVDLAIAPRPVDWDSVPDPPYYPAYEALTPDQRRKYLEWLTDVDRDIQIGYVFVFYYGLERHLFFGRLEEAFEMVLRLRRSHLNGSFASYSGSALVAAAMLHNRPDLFMKYAHAPSALGPTEVSGIYLLAKAALSIPLTPGEIVLLSRTVGFTNRRYIAGHPELFEAVLGALLEREYGQRSLPLNLFPADEWPKETEIIVANISFPPDQRMIPVPQLLRCPKFQRTVAHLLQEAHDAVKAQLKGKSRDGDMQLAKPLAPIAQPVERARVREGHALFPPFDEAQFDRNVRCYDQAVCPYCSDPLPRRPEEAMRCQSCGNRVRARNNFLRGQKGLFREDELTALRALAEERARRNFICDIMEANEISVSEMRSTQAMHHCTPEEALLEATAGKAAEYHRHGNMGLCRNSLLSSGQVYMRVDDRARALTRFLQVAFYDVNGCANAGGIPGSPKFDLRFGESVAPAVLRWITDLADERGMSKTQLREAFMRAANRIYERDMPRPPEQAWETVSRQLWPDE